MKRPVMVWFLVIMISAMSVISILWQGKLIFNGVLQRYPRNVEVLLELTIDIFSMLSVITLFYMKRVSFAIAMAVVLLIVGELCFTLGVARMAKYLFSPSGLYIYFLPISLAVYTGILYFKNELS